MKRKNRARQTTNAISLRRWLAYSAASAAGAVCPPTVHADITVVTPDVVIIDSDPFDGVSEFVYALQLDGPSGTSLIFGHSYTPSYRGFAFVFGSGVGFAGQNDLFPDNLPYGQHLSTLAFSGSFGVLAAFTNYSGSQFANRGGYIGFRFDVGNGNQFGWAEYTLVSGVPQHVFRLERVAWADANESIFVGQVPEPGSLGALALGAVGLLYWRRNRTLTESPPQSSPVPLTSD